MFPLVLPTAANVTHARELHAAHSVPLWDALILAACVEAGVDVLYSEDVPGLETIETVRVINPFQVSGPLENRLAETLHSHCRTPPWWEQVPLRCREKL